MLNDKKKIKIKCPNLYAFKMENMLHQKKSDAKL